MVSNSELLDEEVLKVKCQLTFGSLLNLHKGNHVVVVSNSELLEDVLELVVLMIKISSQNLQRMVWQD